MRVPTRTRRMPGVSGIGLILLLALAGPLMVGCAGTQGSSGSGWQAAGAASGDAAAAPSMPGMASMSPTGGGQGAESTAVVDAAWSARPAFVRTASSATEEAYRFALERGDVLQYMPCTCGCAGMEHRSNLDCFLKPGSTAGRAAWEEHASYCDICVNIALTAKRMIGDGRTLREVRSAIDQQFGGTGAPATNTEQPPA